MSSTTLPTPPAIPAAKTVGAMLREWRQRRGLSQLGLACDADVSTRHLSFVETGRAAPSRSLLMHLAEQLAIPLRERNALLVTAGYAPVFPERGLEDPALAAAHAVVARLLEAQAPFPALAVDRQWTLVNANAMARRLLTEGASPALLAPPVNVMRLALHPEGLAPRIANLPEWRAHLLERLAQQAASTADRGLARLLAELRGYPAPGKPARVPDASEIAVPLLLRAESVTLSLLTTTTVFGTPTDITLSELAIEQFFPADAATAAALRAMADAL